MAVILFFSLIFTTFSGANLSTPHMLTENIRKSELSLAYLHCLAIKKGFELEHTRIDNDSVDATVCANGKIVPDALLNSPKLDIQLKATSNWELKDGVIKFALPVKNYNDLRSKAVNRKILVVVCLPEKEDDWIEYTPNEIIIRRCAYWVSLLGMDETDNENTVTVSLKEMFNADVLHETLLKIANEEW